MKIDLGTGFFKPKAEITELVDGDGQILSDEQKRLTVEFTKLVEPHQGELQAELTSQPSPTRVNIDIANIEATAAEFESTETPVETGSTIVEPTLPSPIHLPEQSAAQQNLGPTPAQVVLTSHTFMSAEGGTSNLPVTPPDTHRSGPPADVKAEAPLPLPQTEPFQANDPKPSIASPEIRHESATVLSQSKPVSNSNPSASPLAPPEPRPIAPILQVENSPIPTMPVRSEIGAIPVKPAPIAPIFAPYPAPANAAPLTRAPDEIPADLEMPVSIRIDKASSEYGPTLQPVSRTAPPIATQISEQIQQQLAKNGQRVIELKLDPPELGRVIIQITANDQSVAALISSDRPETTELMRRHAELLQATLEKSGFSQANLSFEQGNQQADSDNHSPFLELLSAEDPHSETLAPAKLPTLDGRLDIRL